MHLTSRVTYITMYVAINMRCMGMRDKKNNRMGTYNAGKKAVTWYGQEI